MSWVLRPYRDQDMASCLLNLRSNQPEYFADYEYEEFHDDLNHRQTLAEAKQWPYFVLNCGDQILANGGYFIRSDSFAVLIWGMVRGDLHRQGYGSVLLEYRLKHMAGKVAGIEIDTTPASFPFYQKRGFQWEQTINDGYAPGLDKVIAKKSFC
jgi:GNAT superfamily N-acetyltransferase